MGLERSIGASGEVRSALSTTCESAVTGTSIFVAAEQRERGRTGNTGMCIASSATCFDHHVINASCVTSPFSFT